MKTLMTTGIALMFTTSLALASSHGNLGAHFLENWDLDEDGKVSLAEAIEKRGDVFYMFDQDENDVLDSTEYDLFDETRKADQEANGGGMGRGRNNPVNGMARQVTDANKDGQVSRAEFIDSVPAWYARMDKNGDGTVTVNDFGRRKN